MKQEEGDAAFAEIDLGTEMKMARAALLQGKVAGWDAAAGNAKLYISNTENDAPLIQSQLSCGELYGIPAVRFRAIIDPESGVRWYRFPQDRAHVPVWINGKEHRGLQKFTRTSNTVNTFYIWFLDDDYGRRALDAHIRKHGNNGLRHPAETKLYAPVGGYGARRIGNAFYLFDTYIPLRAAIQKPSLSISGKFVGAGGKAAENFVDIGGKNGPLATVTKACFGALSPEFILDRTK